MTAICHIIFYLLCLQSGKGTSSNEKEDGRWQVVDEQDLVTYGTSTSTAFNCIFSGSWKTAREYFQNQLSEQT